MNSRLARVLVVVLILLARCHASAEPAFRDRLPLEPAADVPDRLAWWREARFGLFIHWGLYALPGGIWNGEPATDSHPNPYAEHLMFLKRIPIAEYAPLAGAFHARHFDAGAIARAAKDAGMGYVVLTAKHHDGFAMYGSKASAYNVVSATPFARDPVREMADASRREGLRFGVYYSLGRDWHEADAVNKTQYNLWDFPEPDKGNYQAYLDTKVTPQLQELLTGYGAIDVLWFDVPEQTTLQQSTALELLVHRLQPNCVLNTRVGHDVGDYLEAPDNVQVEAGGRDWEMPGTMAQSWGFSQLDTPEYWKSSRELIRTLVDIVSHGGNYLLNVGPDGEGALPALATQRLTALGRWMRVNGEAIRGAGRSRKREPAWGRYTSKGDLLFAHVFDWPESRVLILSLPLASVSKVELLTAVGACPLVFRPTHGPGIVIELPARAPDPDASVIRISTRS